MRQTLFDLEEGIRQCTACPLWKSRLLAVPGQGIGAAKIMVIGEAPGIEEDRSGLPFIGRSGQFLEKELAKIGISRNNLYITNSVKCHPPQNRLPHSKEIHTCHDLWLEKQIEILKPSLIILLGKAAVFSLLGKSEVGKIHGKIIKKDKLTFFVMYHPSAALRFDKTREIFREDIQKLEKIVKQQKLL